MVSRLPLFLFAFFALLLASCSSSTVVVNNISERDANEIIVLLASRGIPAQKIAAPQSTVGGGTQEKLWDISVPPSQITEALAILNQAGFPRMKGTNLLDLFGSQGLVPSDMQDRIRYQEGLAEQLATTIRKMDGILDADVQISFPQGEEEHKPLTASVYIKHRGILDNPNSLLVTKVKRLVASGVPGLSIDNVTVISDRALYADITYPPNEGCATETQNHVSVWTIVIAQESVTRFRIIFYSFLILIFLLLSALIWVIWKFYPLIEAKGVKIFLKPEPLRPIDFAPPLTPENVETPEDKLL